jgi:hypothetical protein
MSCKAAKEEGVFCKLLNLDCDCIHFKTCCQVRYLPMFFWRKREIILQIIYLPHSQQHKLFVLIPVLLFHPLKISHACSHAVSSP